MCAIAMLAGATSCNKDDIKPEPVPTYAEGVYHPVMQIATVTEDDAVSEQWTWIGDNLDHIDLTAGGTTTYNYSGDLIQKVSSTGNQPLELRYAYSGKQFSKCEAYYENQLAATLGFLHNANGKISTADITVEDAFLLSQLGNIIGGGFLKKMVGKPMAETLVKMAQLSQLDNSKFSMGNKVIGMTLVWDGDDVAKQILNANVSVILDTSDMNLLNQLGVIPQEYQSIIQLAMLYGGGLPLTLSITDTINATYDNNYNPHFCNWGEIFSPQNLSLHNVLTLTNSGVIDVQVTVMGQTMNLYQQPINDYTEYMYQYNDKKYPTEVSGDMNVIYTYKQ